MRVVPEAVVLPTKHALHIGRGDLDVAHHHRAARRGQASWQRLLKKQTAPPTA